MAALFAGTKTAEKTVMLVDIENGSAGAALARLSPHQAPKIFGEVRKRIPLLKTHDSSLLAKEIEKTAKEVLQHAHEVAARVRTHDRLSSLGQTTHALVFLHAPWAHVQFEESGKASVAAAEHMLESLRSMHLATAYDIPLSFHAFSTATAPLLPSVYQISEDTLICIVSSEIVELILVSEGLVMGYATIPFGTRTLIRTLKTHADMSEAEAYSVLKLTQGGDTEALAAAKEHLVREFVDTAPALLKDSYANHVMVVAHEPFGKWFGRALTHEAVGELFNNGGSIRTVASSHISSHIATHAVVPDISLMLAALFADARLSGI